MALPSPSTAPRGVTLLELLIVLTVMGVMSVLVLPAFVKRAPERGAAAEAILASARRTAIRRAEPLRVRFARDGAWLVTALRDNSVVDSGHVKDSLPTTELLLDALGGCVPASHTAPLTTFDPLTCAYARPGTRR